MTQELSRRRLLGAAAAAGAAGTLAVPGAAAAGGGHSTHRVPRDQISVQLYTLRNQLAIDLTLNEYGADLDLDPESQELEITSQIELQKSAATEANGLFTISDDLKKQTVASLAAAGWDVSVEDLFDTTIIDEIYEENPELKDYLP